MEGSSGQQDSPGTPGAEPIDIRRGSIDISFNHGSIGSLRGRQIEPAHGSHAAANSMCQSWGREGALHGRFPVDFFNEDESRLTEFPRTQSSAQDSVRVSFSHDRARSSFSHERMDVHPHCASGAPDDEDPQVTSPLLPTAATPTPASTKSKAQELADAFVVGMINTVAAVPCNLAYVTIMFPNEKFAAFMCPLARLAFLSSAIHQVTMSFFSTLPFAIGQVQDVGLIFLSAMSTSVASLVSAGPGADDAEKDKAARVMVTTTLLAMTLATCLTGVLLMLVGWRKWAGMIAYIPQPVVAGYLGYVGYFCLAAGAAQSSGKTVTTLPTWGAIFQDDCIVRTAAGFASFLFIYFTIRYWKHPLCMPIAMCAVPAAYYVVLGGIMVTYGMSWKDLMHELAKGDWITLPPETAGGALNFWEVYELYDVFPWDGSKVAWGALLRQVPMAFALFSVVLFGSCLDITAIQANLPYEVDYNGELQTVGLANLLTSFAGAGFTGSYIFSQTTWSQRTGCTHRLNGAVVAIAEAALFFFPISVMQLLPNFYYGAIMLVLGVEIALDWLVFSYSKFTATEYALTLTNFVLIMICTDRYEVSGLEMGILIGIVVCALHFAVEYSTVQLKEVTAMASVSSCVRPMHQRAVLEMFHSHMQVVALSGYIFFGSAVQLGERISALAAALDENTEAAITHFECLSALAPSPAKRLESSRSALTAALHETRSPSTKCPGKTAVDGGSSTPPLDDAASADVQQRLAMAGLACEAAPAALRGAQRFLLVDFSTISGLDATAAATFKKMSMSCALKGVVMVLTGVQQPSSTCDLSSEGASQSCYKTFRLLAGNDVVAIDHCPNSDHSVISGFCPCFSNLDDALAWCESYFLKVAVEMSLMPNASDVLTLPAILKMHMGSLLLGENSGRLLPMLTADEVSKGLLQFAEIVQLRAGEDLYRVGEQADAMYIILSGEVVCDWDLESFSRGTQLLASTRSSSAPGHVDGAARRPRHKRAPRRLRYSAGGVTGDMEFFLQRTRTFGARCTVDAKVVRLMAKEYQRMMMEAPLVAVMLQHVRYLKK